MTEELLREKAEWGLKHNNGGFWYNLSGRVDLTMDFVREYADYLNWYALSKNGYLHVDEEFLNEFKDKIHWRSFTRYSPSMNEKIARKFA